MSSPATTTAFELAGSTYEFKRRPAYIRETGSEFSLAFSVLLLLSGVYKLRLQSLGRQLQVRYEERLSERTRIARELHDTLLQSFQDWIFRFRLFAICFRRGPRTR